MTGFDVNEFIVVGAIWLCQLGEHEWGIKKNKKVSKKNKKNKKIKKK